MDETKAKVEEFLHKSGHHDTTVHEKVLPAVTNETIKPTHHTEHITAIDRERHQDHYHTTVQPIKHREILPEKHSHEVVAVDHRHIEHGNDQETRARLEQERAQFRDTTQSAKVQKTESEAPVIAGEHIHHHVYETIQPVVHKETIQPSVVHHTVPIHEVHHHEPKHHAASALPAMSLADFKKQGGSLTGRDERIDGFEGEPRPVETSLGSSSATSSHRGTTGNGTTSTRGTTERAAAERVGNDRAGTDRVGNERVLADRTGTNRGTTDGPVAEGPFDSKLANNGDSRLESDHGLGHNATDSVGSTGSNVTRGTNATSGTTSTPRTSASTADDAGGSPLSNTTSPSGVRHSSKLLNKLDPRV